MIDIDYAPGVFAVVIAFVFVLPGIFGYTLIDKFWKKHQEANDTDDAFN